MTKKKQYLLLEESVLYIYFLLETSLMKKRLKFMFTKKTASFFTKK